MNCPYCQSQNDDEALVCRACARDIAIPVQLKAERDELLRKRELIQDELRKAEAEIAMIRNRRKAR